MSPDARTPGQPAKAGRGRPERIILVGFMASGKSAVGRLLAVRIGYAFVDLDAEVEQIAGKSIPDIFGRQGEAHFRALEEEATRRCDPLRGVVIATGGGWMARPELRDRWPEATRVWLQVSPDAVIMRAGREPAIARPLLAGPAPERAVRRLLEIRTPAYALAELCVETDGRAPEEVADRICSVLQF